MIEFNARFGDPECMNIMSLFEGSWTEVMTEISDGRLTAAAVPLRGEASVVLYLVSPDYALRKGPPYEFTLDTARLEGEGCNVFFSSAVSSGEGTYRTVGTSRAVALATTAPSLEQARERLARCAETVPVLEWRREVGDEQYLRGAAPAGGDLRVFPDAMIVETSTHPQFVSNTYLLADGDGGPAFFVDAGGPVEPLIEAADRLRPLALAPVAHPPPLRPRQRDLEAA